MNKAVETLKIVGLCILAAVIYGIVHDQITARVYLPYFTVFHPHVIDSEDPTVVALVWGVIATWWVGLILGFPLAYSAIGGRTRPLAFSVVVRAVAILLMVMAGCAAMAGLGSYAVGFRAPSFVYGPRMAFESDHELRRFTAVWVTHNASYFVGFFGGVALCFWALFKRGRDAMEKGL